MKMYVFDPKMYVFGLKTNMLDPKMFHFVRFVIFSKFNYICGNTPYIKNI